MRSGLSEHADSGGPEKGQAASARRGGPPGVAADARDKGQAAGGITVVRERRGRPPVVAASPQEKEVGDCRRRTESRRRSPCPVPSRVRDVPRIARDKIGVFKK